MAEAKPSLRQRVQQNAEDETRRRIEEAAALVRGNPSGLGSVVEKQLEKNKDKYKKQEG